MSDQVELEPVSPAASAAIRVAPALVTAVQEDPDALTKLTRGQLLLVQDRMVRKVLSDPDASATALAVVHERLSKNARLEPEKGAENRGTGFSVVINLGEVPQSKVIDIKAEPHVE
jgi:hypothetical protein